MKKKWEGVDVVERPTHDMAGRQFSYTYTYTYLQEGNGKQRSRGPGRAAPRAKHLLKQREREGGHGVFQRAALVLPRQPVLRLPRQGMPQRQA
jgi:hypothetical protein